MIILEAAGVASPLAKLTRGMVYSFMAKRKEFPVERFQEAIEYNPSTGTFTFKMKVSPSRYKGSNALGHLNKNGYYVVQMDRKETLAQRVAYVLMNGKWPVGMLRFKDGNRQNLKWENIEETVRVEGEFDHNTPEGRSIYRKAYHAQKPEKNKENHYLNTFGITVEKYETMLAAQDGKCKLCDCGETAMLNGKPLALAVDHDHATGQIRSLLCRNHNVGLGLFGDDPALLRRAADYLENYKKLQSNDMPSNVVVLKGMK